MKITVEIDGKEVEMSLKAAKKLRKDLNELLDSTYIPYPHYPLQPWNPQYTPLIPDGPFEFPYKVTCGQSSYIGPEINYINDQNIGGGSSN